MDYSTGVAKSIRSTRLADLDLLLVQRMAAGDPHALDELYARHGPHLLAYLAGRLGDAGLAEEVLQDVMLAAWQHAAAFRGRARVRTWLLAIARRRAINAHRRRQPAPAIPLDDESDRLAATDSPPSGISDALASLPEALRETLELVFYHGLSGVEAAEVLGVPAGTVKSRLHHARARLRRWFEEQTATDE